MTCNKLSKIKMNLLVGNASRLLCNFSPVASSRCLQGKNSYSTSFEKNRMFFSIALLYTGQGCQYI
jgi:hypothetical protein